MPKYIKCDLSGKLKNNFIRIQVAQGELSRRENAGADKIRLESKILQLQIAMEELKIETISLKKKIESLKKQKGNPAGIGREQASQTSLAERGNFTQSIVMNMVKPGRKL